MKAKPCKLQPQHLSIHAYVYTHIFFVSRTFLRMPPPESFRRGSSGLTCSTLLFGSRPFFPVCSILVGPCAQRASVRQHAPEGGCGQASPASARRRGVHVGRVRAHQHYSPRLEDPGGTLKISQKPACRSTLRPKLQWQQLGKRHRSYG